MDGSAAGPRCWRRACTRPPVWGRQSPKMVVVQDRATRDQLSRMNAAVMNSTGDPFYGAPTVIVVLADPAAGTWREDGSLVMGN